MKSSADETGRSKELAILVKFFKQLHAAARMRITHAGIWIIFRHGTGTLSHNKHNLSSAIVGKVMGACVEGH